MSQFLEIFLLAFFFTFKSATIKVQLCFPPSNWGGLPGRKDDEIFVTVDICSKFVSQRAVLFMKIHFCKIHIAVCEPSLMKSQLNIT